VWKNKVQFFHTSLQNAWGRFAPFPQASRPSIHKQQNRTFHLLQKPDISICYRHESFYANLHGARSLKLGKPSIFAELTTTAMLLSFYPRKSGTFDVA